MAEQPKKVKARGQAKAAATPDDVATTESIRALALKAQGQQIQYDLYAAKEGTVYIRNVREIPVRVTLDTGRRIELSPRGQIDDLTPLSLEEQGDSKFIINIGLLYEVISASDASAIIRKQATNAQAPRNNPLLAMLTNERGEAYEEGSVRIEAPSGSNDIVVAKISNASDTAHNTGNTAIERVQVQDVKGPKRAAVPGSVENPVGAGADITDEDVREFLEWKRWKAAQAIREELSVTIEEPQTETPE